uniref:RING-type E3 ubiquitin transferase n=1 Tax=Kalanchoe fedtschenkoi TaxID=63787 RepID=A0A7N0TAJ7_KALFE
MSTSSDHSVGSARKTHDLSSLHEFSYASNDSGRTSCSSENLDEVEAEMKRLKEELKHTMDMYSTACKEALTAKQKAMELSRWRLEEEKRLQEARLSEEAALAVAQKERVKCRAAVEAAQAHQKIAEIEAQKRLNVEMKALKSSEEMRKAISTFNNFDNRYRRYTIEEIEAATDFFSESRKIGEGGYGPVYKCYLDHTQVAIKVLRPDAAQGRAQFQQEIEVLSCIRHPNMVLLLGACPEYGCLVYEYMANGSLEDCLFQRGNTPPMPWQIRFRVAAEIATGLLFLHQTKPEPLVHRDLKPANILLDHNYSSKISDVGLARLVPPSVADSVTQYRMTSTAGTFCYIDPEYQQTGMLGVKSDVYSLGILLLQLITGKSPMGLTYHVENSIETGTFSEMLDPSVPDWPMEEALKYAKLALQCAELRRKDRPDLGGVVLPELNQLRELADQSMPVTTSFSSSSPPHYSSASVSQDVISHTPPAHSVEECD